MSAEAVTPWQVVGRSVRGATHLRDGLPNQDAVAHRTIVEGGQPALAIAAVADGHGGRRHFRSADGARMAVEVALQVLCSMATHFEQLSPADRSELAAAQVPMAIVSAWTDAVRRHLATCPISDEEWLALDAAEGSEGSAAVRADPLLAYGATLLAALTTPNSVALWQLGDGDVLAVSPDGSVNRPVATDERLLGNLTTSICRPGAEADFRSVVLSSHSALPALLMLSTDGYANSFRTDADFLKVGADLLELISKHGLSAIDARLGGILEDASANGSGDDITAALLYRSGSEPSVLSTSGGGWPPAELAVASAAPSDGGQALAAAQRRIARLRSVIVVLLVVLLAGALWWSRDRSRPKSADLPALGAPIGWDAPASGPKPSFEAAEPAPVVSPQGAAKPPLAAKPKPAASAASRPKPATAPAATSKPTPELPPY